MIDSLVDCYTVYKMYVHTQTTVNDEKLIGLKFGESANKSVWRKEVWQIHPKL